MGTPSPSVVACFKIICFFFIGHSVKPAKPKDIDKIKDYDPEGFFTRAKQEKTILASPADFLKGLKGYEKDNMP